MEWCILRQNCNDNFNIKKNYLPLLNRWITFERDGEGVGGGAGREAASNHVFVLF